MLVAENEYGPDFGARAAKRRDRPRGGPAAGPDERVSPSLHLARATMKHTSAAQQRSTVWFSLKSSQLEYASRFSPVLRGNKSAGLQHLTQLETA